MLCDGVLWKPELLVTALPVGRLDLGRGGEVNVAHLPRFFPHQDPVAVKPGDGSACGPESFLHMAWVGAGLTQSLVTRALLSPFEDQGPTSKGQAGSRLRPGLLFSCIRELGCKRGSRGHRCHLKHSAKVLT